VYEITLTCPYTHTEIKIYLNERYCEDRVERTLPDVVPIQNGLKQGSGLLTLLLSTAAGQVISDVQEKTGGTGMNEIH
jgi:hypothetical protein